jgi:hypothetical protein
MRGGEREDIYTIALHLLPQFWSQQASLGALLTVLLYCLVNSITQAVHIEIAAVRGERSRWQVAGRARIETKTFRKQSLLWSSDVKRLDEIGSSWISNHLHPPNHPFPSTQ